MSGILGKKLRSKLIYLFLITVVVSISGVGSISYFLGREALRQQALNNLMAIAQARTNAVILYIRSEQAKCNNFSSDGYVRNALEGMSQKTPDSTLSFTEELSDNLKDKVKLNQGIYEIFVMNTAGIIVASTDSSNIGEDRSSDECFTGIAGTKNTLHIKDAYYSKDADKNTMAYSAPIKSRTTGDFLGVIVNRVESSELNDITTNRKGLGETGEIYIVNRNKYMITESRFLKDTFLKQKVDTEPVRLFQEQNKEMTGIYADYRGESIVGASVGAAMENEFGLGWTLLAEIDKAEVFAPTSSLARTILLYGAIITAIAAVVGWFFSNTISRPISNASQEIATTSTQIATACTQHEKTAMQQTTAVNETTTTMSELDSSARKSTEQADSALAASQKALAMSKDGLNTVEKTLEGMNSVKEKVSSIAENILQLSEQIGQIGSITNLVTDLANQTNLLALNAAVEAARAGEHGKGFSVVAVEIRKLADESKKSAEKINNLVSDIQKSTDSTVMVTEEGTKNVEDGTELVHQTGEAFKELAESNSNATENVQQILLNVKQQAAATKQVVETMNAIKTGAKETAAGLSQTKGGIQKLNETVSRLQEMI